MTSTIFNVHPLSSNAVRVLVCPQTATCINLPIFQRIMFNKSVWIAIPLMITFILSTNVNAHFIFVRHSFVTFSQFPSESKTAGTVCCQCVAGKVH